MGRTWVKSHYVYRSGKRVRIKGYWRKTVGSRGKGRSGDKFKALEKRVYAEYRKKGYSKTEAEHIARATAGKVFWEKYGKRSGSRILRRER